MMEYTNFKRRILPNWSQPCENFINNYIISMAKATGISDQCIWETHYPAELENNTELLRLNDFDPSFQTLIFKIIGTVPNFNTGHSSTREDRELYMLKFLSAHFIDNLLALYTNNNEVIKSEHLDFNNFRITYHNCSPFNIDIEFPYFNSNMYLKICLKH